MPELVSFHEERFPTNIAFRSSGGPERRTEIVTLGSGHEQRNARWQNSRRRFDAGYGVKNLDDLYAIITFFEERRGALFGFRFRDPLDWKSCPPLKVPTANDQAIGAGDGVRQSFFLTKTYGSNAAAYIRPVVKPVEGSVLIAVDSMVQNMGSDYTIDHETGEVVFQSSNIPAVATEVSAGFQFDVPVRFATDQLTINLAAFEAGDIPSIPVIEIKL